VSRFLDSSPVEVTTVAQRTPVLDPPLEDVILAYEREGPIPVSEEVYLRLALDDPDTQWELHDGLLVEKPGMSYRHGDVSFYLGHQLATQLDPSQFRVRVNHGRVHRSGGGYFVPDVMVIPVTILGSEIDRPDILETYEVPLPFVAEAWSPTTGKHDVDTKLPGYRDRGDEEIWRLHPFERTVVAWRRRPDGTYDVFRFSGGKVQLHALPTVVIDLDALFA
jgi:Uma2 family endonuclease